MPVTASGPGPRERMVYSAAQLIRRDGVAATGMRDVAEHAHAPRGSLQHYFPGGKEQLVNEAVDWSARYAAKRIGRVLAALPRPTPGGLFAGMAQQWIDDYLTRGYGYGCPVAAAVVDCADSVESTRTAAAAAFDTWRRPAAEALVAMGVPEWRADGLATLMISSIEGALLFARTEKDVSALETVVRELQPLLDASVEASVVVTADASAQSAAG